MSAKTKAAKAATNAISVSQKYTVQSHGIWDRIRRAFAVDPNRSTGVPLNPVYRNPPPGGNDPKQYDDPVTAPAGDIADNPYWRRDLRRMYPGLSTVTQGDVAALLTVGSAAAPKDDVLQLGAHGEKQLVAVRDEAAEQGLSGFFEKQRGLASGVLENGLPPLPPAIGEGVKGRKYELLPEQSYENAYPCRTFS